MSNTLELDIAWGGYYACTTHDSDEVSIIRLLDFNIDAYHAALYSQVFDKTPSATEIAKLTPLVGHVPMASKALLLNKTMTLIDRKPLVKQDLDGYMLYLEDCEVPEAERNEVTETLISYCADDPMKVTLSLADDKLKVDPRK